MAISPVIGQTHVQRNPEAEESGLATLASRVTCFVLSTLASAVCYSVFPGFIGIPAAIFTFLGGLRMGGVIGSSERSWTPTGDWIPSFPRFDGPFQAQNRDYRRLPVPVIPDSPPNFGGDRHRVGEDDEPTYQPPVINHGGLWNLFGGHGRVNPPHHERHRIGEDDEPTYQPPVVNHGGIWNLFGGLGRGNPPHHERHRVGEDDLPSPMLRGGGRHRVGEDDF